MSREELLAEAARLRVRAREMRNGAQYADGNRAYRAEMDQADRLENQAIRLEAQAARL